MPTIKELAARMNRDAAQGLARTARAMPEDKATWKPLDKGRTALDQVQECAGLCYYGARLLRAREVPPFDQERYAQFRAENDTLEKALAALEAGTDDLVKAIEEFPEEHLDDQITLPFGGGMTMSFAEVMLMNYWNTVYHVGQVNYIQTLYGDTDMH